MTEYFVIRSSTDEHEKKWILREIRAGRLRQGWFAHKGTALVSSQHEPVDQIVWTRNFRQVARQSVPSPKTAVERRRLTPEFAEQKYRELARLLHIREGARLIVPKLDPNAEEKGFVLARAATASRSAAHSNGCYWFDLTRRAPGTPKDDYRHVVAVDRSSVRAIPRDFSKLAARICDDLELREAPVIHSRDDDFNQRVERIYSETMQNAEGPYEPKPASAVVERQKRELIEQQIMQRRAKRNSNRDYSTYMVVAARSLVAMQKTRSKPLTFAPSISRTITMSATVCFYERTSTPCST
jgi:hypothetical protein